MRLMVTEIFLIFFSLAIYAEGTELKLYHPFSEGLNQATVIIQQTYQGDCGSQSEIIKREDAWRCVAKGKIYDPCFVKQFSKHLTAVCPLSPWVGQSIRIKLNVPIDNSKHQPLDLSRTYPWAVELITGEKCQAMGEKEAIEGLPIRYHCEGKNVLFGHLQRCKTPWSILKRNPMGQVSTVKIARAWF